MSIQKVIVLTSEDQILDDACQKIQQIPKVRFVGVLDKMGKKIAGGFKEGLSSYLEDKQNQMMYVQLTLEYLMRRDFDDKLGAIDYIASRRGKVTMISIPTKEYLILISAQRDIDVEEMIREVNLAFTTLPNVPP